MKILMYCRRHYHCVNCRWRDADARPTLSAMPPGSAAGSDLWFPVVENAGSPALGKQEFCVQVISRDLGYKHGVTCWEGAARLRANKTQSYLAKGES